MEDETGMVQAMIRPDLLRKHLPFLVSTPVILVEGTLQNTDGTLLVKEARFEGEEADSEIACHDFH